MATNGDVGTKTLSKSSAGGLVALPRHSPSCSFPFLLQPLWDGSGKDFSLNDSDQLLLGNNISGSYEIRSQIEGFGKVN